MMSTRFGFSLSMLSLITPIRGAGTRGVMSSASHDTANSARTMDRSMAADHDTSLAPHTISDVSLDLGDESELTCHCWVKQPDNYTLAGTSTPFVSRIILK